jgi:hypothetical protein
VGFWARLPVLLTVAPPDTRLTFGNRNLRQWGYFTHLRQHCYSTVTTLTQHFHNRVTTLSQVSQHCRNRVTTLSTLTQHCHNFDTSVTTLTQHSQQCHNTFTTLTQHCHNTDTAVSQLFHNTDTTVSQLFHNTDTTLTQHCHNSVTTQNLVIFSRETFEDFEVLQFSMSATTTQLLSSGEFCKLRCDTVPVKKCICKRLSFLIPITQKCQILSCDTLVANESDLRSFSIHRENAASGNWPMWVLNRDNKGKTAVVALVG